jgi:hypothetical protein
MSRSLCSGRQYAKCRHEAGCASTPGLVSLAEAFAQSALFAHREPAVHRDEDREHRKRQQRAERVLAVLGEKEMGRS